MGQKGGSGGPEERWREEECLQSFNPTPTPPTYTDVRDSVSNRRQGTYLYIALTFHRMCCAFLPGWTAGVDVGPGGGAGHTQKWLLDYPVVKL